MRLGVLIGVGPSHGRGAEIAAEAARLEEAGLDVALLQGDPDGPADALTAAAFLAGSTAALRLVASVPAGVHPVHIAEQAAVADNALQGRLLLSLEQADADVSVLSETAEAVLNAAAPRPFRHRGTRWAIPGNVDGNISERRISVTPNPAQLELPLWVRGAAASGVAAEFGLSYLAGAEEGMLDAARAWAEVERSLGRAALRMRRPAIRRVNCGATGDFDDAQLTRELADERDLWGLDVAILTLPSALTPSARARAVRRLASLVRPPLQMDAIPARVREYWKQELPARLEG